MIYYNDSHCHDPTEGIAISNIRRQERLKQKRLRDMTWEDYGISKYRYRELKAFCLQYPEKKEQLSYGLTSVAGDGSGRSGKIGRPTELQAMHNEHYSKDVMIIEQAAVAASANIYPWILASVTEDLNYKELLGHTSLGPVPICEKDFYGVRRLFYSILDKKRK